MIDRAPWAYRILYSRGTAAGLVLLSGMVLAVSQTHVIRDWLAVLHHGWSVPWLWVNAAGFELTVIATGLVLAATGRRSLWIAETFLILVSCLAAWDSAPAGTPAVRAILGSLMPLQYLAAVLAGHRLAGRGGPSGETDEGAAGAMAAALALDAQLEEIGQRFNLASPAWDDDAHLRADPYDRASPRLDKETGRPPKRPARLAANRAVIGSRSSSAEHLLGFLQQRGGSSSVLEAAATSGVSRAQIYRLAKDDARFVATGGVVRLVE